MSRKKKERTPAPLPFRSEAFQRDSKHKIERIQRALQSAEKNPSAPSNKGKSFFEIADDVTPKETEVSQTKAVVLADNKNKDNHIVDKREDQSKAEQTTSGKKQAATQDIATKDTISSSLKEKSSRGTDAKENSSQDAAAASRKKPASKQDGQKNQPEKKEKTQKQQSEQKTQQAKQENPKSFPATNKTLVTEEEKQKKDKTKNSQAVTQQIIEIDDSKWLAFRKKISSFSFYRKRPNIEEISEPKPVKPQRAYRKEVHALPAKQNDLVQKNSDQTIEPKDKVKISSKQLSLEERERRRQAIRNERHQRQPGKTTKRKRNTKPSDKTTKEPSWRERWIKNRLAKQQMKRERALQRAEALTRSDAPRHWSQGIPLLEKLYKNKQEKPPASEQVPTSRLINFLKQKERERQARQAKKLWQNIVGLDIGSSHIRAVMIQEGNLVLAEREIPDGIIVRGILAEPDELTAELETLWREEEIPSNKVNISFCNKLSVLKVVDIQADSEEDIQQALALNADVFVAPMNADDVLIDYATLSKTGQGRMIQVVAADQVMISSFIDAIEESGLIVAGAELAPLAASRVLRVPRKKNSANILVDIGAETTTLAIESGPDVFYLRIIEIGGNDFTKAIEEETSLSWSEAEEWKKSLQNDNAPASKVLQKTIDRFCTEIAQTVKIYEKSSEAKILKTLYIAGGGSYLPGLKEQLAFVLNKPLGDTLDPVPDLKVVPVETPTWAPALGLAYGHSMSLLPEKKGPLKGQRKTSKISREAANERAKQMTIARKRPLANNKLLTVLVFMLVLFAAFLWGQKINSDAQKLSEDLVTIKQVAQSSNSFQEKQRQDKLRQLIAELPNWKEITQTFENAEIENLKLIQFSVLGKNFEITFRDNRSVEELQTIFKNTTIEENSSGEKTMRPSQ